MGSLGLACHTMSNPTHTPSWPRDLQESWQHCVQRGEVDAANPPSSTVEAYLQVAEALARRLGGFRHDEPGQDDRPDDEADELYSDLAAMLATCSECGTGNLRIFTGLSRRALCCGLASFRSMLSPG